MTIRLFSLILGIFVLTCAGFTACAELPLLNEKAKNEQDAKSDENASAATGNDAQGTSRSAATEIINEEHATPAKTKTASGSLGSDLLKSTKKGDQVLAVVDSEKIMASDLYELYLMDNPLKARRFVEDFALFILVRKEAERMGVSIGSDEVEKRIDAMIREQQGRIALNLDESLTIEEFVRLQYRMEMAEYRDLLRQSAVFQGLLERCVRYLELRVKRFQVGVIIVDDAAKADRIRKKLEKGANFEVLAKENSNKATGSTAGVLPPLPADMDYPVIKESLELKKGGVSEVKETYVGRERFYRIVKLIDIIEPTQGTYAELEAEVEADIEERPLVVPDLIQYWRDALEDRYSIEFMES